MTKFSSGEELRETAFAARLAKPRIVIVEDLTGFGVGRSTMRGRAWGPEQAEGPPNVPAAGSNSLAWTSLGADDRLEWLVCEYAKPVDARAVIVHANAFPGALTKVSAFNEKGDEIIAWEGEDPTPRSKARGVSVIPIKLAFPVQRIKVSIDSPAVSGWNEIDAVGLEDADGNVLWAKHVEASTTYASIGMGNNPSNSKPSYSAAQAAGEPDATRPGDNSNAWCPATADRAEWLVCEYKTPQAPMEIVVHENMGPGSITKISAFDADNKEVTVWEGVDPTPRDQQWGVSVFPLKAALSFRKLKLHLACDKVPGYQEIDAVGLRDLNGNTQWATEVEASSTYGSSQPIDLVGTTAMPAMARPDDSFRELQKEVESLRKQVEELQKLKKDLEGIRELKELLKEKLK